MKRTPLVIIFLSILVLMEVFAWRIFKSSQEPVPDATLPREETVQDTLAPPTIDFVPEETETGLNTTPQASSQASPTQRGDADSSNFPPPTVEMINGRMERTVHMGVRQYAWDPSTITVKKGELVRLIIHNADVKHGLAIPELGVNQDIPEDGAVIAFTPDKTGTFEFFCSVWCGEGHMEMQGRIVVE